MESIPHGTVPVVRDASITQGTTMIQLTKLSGEPFVLNAELIKYVEALPDTFITLTTGEHIVVKEAPDEIIHRTVEYHQHKLLIPATANRALADERNRVV